MRRFSVKAMLCASFALLPAVTALAQTNEEKLRKLGLASGAAPTPGIGRVILSFVLVAGLTVGAAWLWRRMGWKLPNARAGAPENIRLLSRAVLPGGVHCHLIETQGRQVLITVTKSGVSALPLAAAVPESAP
jgi:flagellar biogenesis protein FliO